MAEEANHTQVYDGLDTPVEIDRPYKAYAEKYDRMSLIQVDAHTDTWADNNMGRVDYYYYVLQGG